MKKSSTKKDARWLTRARTLRLVFGLAVVYLSAVGAIWLSRHFGGESMLIIGFLGAFILMPALLLLIFTIPMRRRRDVVRCLAFLTPCLGWCF
ncbi:hypothetical protein [Asaia astilbis]|uniref:hypothetical protein n=1 Tax=Asaia astilbis TaxID=610244 RepID=UPI0004721A6D|nr:hypothetical protein [Asaia astilbis]